MPLAAVSLCLRRIACLGVLFSTGMAGKEFLLRSPNTYVSFAKRKVLREFSGALLGLKLYQTIAVVSCTSLYRFDR